MCGFLTISLFVYASMTLGQLWTVAHSYSKNTGSFVILLHGLGRSSLSMLPIGSALARDNYRVVNVGYPSRSATISELSQIALADTIADIRSKDATADIHIVTHSLGGILTRYYLTEMSSTSITSVVMLAPPHQGSAMADTWSSHTFGRWILGPAISELRTDTESTVRTLSPDMPVPVGIIVGAKDHKVSVENAFLTTSTPTIIFPYRHTFIMYTQNTIDAILTFLKTNSF